MSGSASPRGAAAPSASASADIGVGARGRASASGSAGGRTGTLYGVGVGPGDPQLITVKARAIIEAADVIAYTSKAGGESLARNTVKDHLSERHLQMPLVYPVTVEQTDHAGGYEGALEEFYETSARLIAKHLDAGLDVAVLCEGDPFFYGSYMYLHERLKQRYTTEVIPGVTSVSAAAAAAGTPLAKRDDVLTVLPGTLDADALSARLRDADAAAVLKLGRRFRQVREAVNRAGVAERALYVERASCEAERLLPVAEVDPDQVPYMSLLLMPTANARGRLPTTAALETGALRRPARPPRPGEDAPVEEAAGCVAVVGLGPGAQEWITPEAQAELAAAHQLLGYGPYLDRVPVLEGQRRHASGNSEEAGRAAHALALASAGARVAVVSSGDPGIFAMASAVFEQLAQLQQEGRDPGVQVRVIPGVSAMQAAAARLGAPLGHDFCVISLSDRLKPWSVVERRLTAAAQADLVIAIYNPASKTRRRQLARAREVLLGHRGGETPLMIARAVGSSEESVKVRTLRDADLDDVDMRTLLIVGSSQTRVLRCGATGRPLVFTPRCWEGE